jgi:hypothetical protein
MFSNGVRGQGCKCVKCKNRGENVEKFPHRGGGVLVWNHAGLDCNPTSHLTATTVTLTKLGFLGPTITQSKWK